MESTTGSRPIGTHAPDTDASLREVIEHCRHGRRTAISTRLAGIARPEPDGAVARDGDLEAENVKVIEVPASAGKVDGALQAIAEGDAPWWRLPAPAAGQQLFDTSLLPAGATVTAAAPAVAPAAAVAAAAAAKATSSMLGGPASGPVLSPSALYASVFVKASVAMNSACRSGSGRAAPAAQWRSNRETAGAAGTG